MNRPVNPDPSSLRLNRFLADAGFGSRRAVEGLVRQGRVTLNKNVVRDLATRVDPVRDRVTVDGRAVSRLVSGACFAFHKPLAVVCTLRGQGGQPTLAPYKRGAELAEPVMPIGRLDADSTGLLLWTDDGTLNQAVCRPGSQIWKTYRVVLARPLGSEQRRRFRDGTLVLDGRPCRPCRLRRLGGQEWEVQLHEGRRRQIRRMFRALGNRVDTLHRTSFGPIELGDLPPGAFRPLTDDETAALHRAARPDGDGQRKE